MNDYAWWQRSINERVAFAKEDIASAQDEIDAAKVDLRKAEAALERERRALASALADQQAFELDPARFLAGKKINNFINRNEAIRGN